MSLADTQNVFFHWKSKLIGDMMHFTMVIMWCIVPLWVGYGHKAFCLFLQTESVYNVYCHKTSWHWKQLDARELGIMWGSGSTS